jgi:cyanophycinase
MAYFSLFLFLLAQPAQAKWKYLRTGNPTDSTVTPRAGFALMGGGSQQDPAFHFLCERASGGDFLVLSANDEDDYLKKENEKIRAICPLNSVATLSFFSREDASDPQVVKIIEKAESIFIAGGDQSDYVRYWQDTPVQEALNRHIVNGKPIGGSSAGLAILGEFAFASLIDTLHSPEALANPYGNKVTLTRDFLRIPLLADTITDTHFVKRDRLGRLLVFLARIVQDGWAKRVRAIAVDENTALLVEPDGSSHAVGHGPVFFLEASAPPEVCAYRQPLTFHNITVQRVQPGKSFQIKTWSGEADTYDLTVVKGSVQASGNSPGVY